jgi:hypothetical protein
MRTFLLLICVLLVTWLQFVFPANLAPWHLIPDLLLLFMLGLALYFEPVHVIIWAALFAGVMLDLWHPGSFGKWIVCTLLFVLLVIIIHSRILPRLTRPGILLTGAAGLILAGLFLFIWDWVGSGTSFGQALSLSGRVYALRILFDLVLLLPIVWFTRKLVKGLDPFSAKSRL